MKPEIRIIKHEPRHIEISAKDKLSRFLFGLPGHPEEEFPFGIEITADTIIFQSTTRWRTEEDATAGARKAIDSLEAFFDELRAEEKR